MEMKRRSVLIKFYSLNDSLSGKQIVMSIFLNVKLQLILITNHSVFIKLILVPIAGKLLKKSLHVKKKKNVLIIQYLQKTIINYLHTPSIRFRL